MKKLDNLFDSWNNKSNKKSKMNGKIDVNKKESKIQNVNHNVDSDIHTYCFYDPDGPDDKYPYKIVNTKRIMRLGPDDFEL